MRLAIVILQLITAMIVFCFLIPILLSQCIILSQNHSPIGLASAILALILSILLAGYSMAWQWRHRGFLALHDYFYHYKGRGFTEYTPDDYVGKEFRDFLYAGSPDLDRPAKKRTNAIRIFYVSALKTVNARVRKANHGLVAYGSPLGLGISYVFIPFRPGSQSPIYKFQIYHELSHVRTNIDLYEIEALLGYLPYQLTVIWLIPLLVWSKLSVFLLVTLALLAFVIIPRIAVRRRSLVRLQREVEADNCALAFMESSDLERLRKVFSRSENSFEDKLLPAEFSVLRQTILRENIDARVEGREVKLVRKFTLVPISLRLLFLANVATLSYFAARPSVPSILYQLLGVAFPLGLMIALTVRSLNAITAEIDHAAGITNFMVGLEDHLAGFLSERVAEEDPLDQLRPKTPSSPPFSLSLFVADAAHDYEEPLVYKLVDLFSRLGIPGSLGLRVSRWTNISIAVAEQEIESYGFFATEDQFNQMNIAFQGAMLVERRLGRQFLCSGMYVRFNISHHNRYKSVVDNTASRSDEERTDWDRERIVAVSDEKSADFVAELITLPLPEIDTRIREYIAAESMPVITQFFIALWYATEMTNGNENTTLVYCLYRIAQLAQKH